MRKIILLLCALSLSNVQASTKKMNVFLEFKGWPDQHMKEWQSALSELSAADKCYDTDGQKAIEANESSSYCATYSMFKSVEQLKPYSKEL